MSKEFAQLHQELTNKYNALLQNASKIRRFVVWGNTHPQLSKYQQWPSVRSRCEAHTRKLDEACEHAETAKDGATKDTAATRQQLQFVIRALDEAKAESDAFLAEYNRFKGMVEKIGRGEEALQWVSAHPKTVIGVGAVLGAAGGVWYAAAAANAAAAADAAIATEAATAFTAFLGPVAFGVVAGVVVVGGVWYLCKYCAEKKRTVWVKQLDDLNAMLFKYAAQVTPPPVSAAPSPARSGTFAAAPATASSMLVIAQPASAASSDSSFDKLPSSPTSSEDSFVFVRCD